MLYNPTALMAYLLDEARCLQSTDVVGGVGCVGATDVLTDIFEMQGPIGSAISRLTVLLA
jgi:hypothetical protein